MITNMLCFKCSKGSHSERKLMYRNHIFCCIKLLTTVKYFHSSPSIISVPDSRSAAFFLSGWWKIQMIQVLLRRSAVGRRKRKTRTETGEKMNMRAEMVLTMKKRSDAFIPSFSSSESPSPSPQQEKKKSKKKKKKRYSITGLSLYVSCNFFTMID